jgi:dihydrofolate synthase / folylpolyglutamate synthase
MAETALAGWLARLEKLHPSEIDLGLERVGAVALAMGLLPVSCPVITVAGTNGKGSTVAVMEQLLTAQGYRAGVSTSPHFLRFNERIRVAGAEVDDAKIVAAFEAVEAARGNISLTYFEFATLASLWVFRDCGVDFMILEVGLGGRLDAANIVDPTVAIITSIDLDHQQWLGDTRGAIAREKAGILRRGIRAVIAEPAPPEELLACLHEQQAKALQLGRDFGYEGDGKHWRGFATTQQGARRSLPAMAFGSLLPANICAGIQALLQLGVDCEDALLLDALAKVQPGGRCELLEVDGNQLILDVAHNPAAVQVMSEFLCANPCDGATLAIFSPMGDKDIRAMIAAMDAGVQRWYLADQPDTPRAASAEQVAGLVLSAGRGPVSVFDDLTGALAAARKALTAGDRLVVFGSFYTIAAIRQQLDAQIEKSRIG